MSIKSKKTADSATYRKEPTSSESWSEWSDAELNAESWDYPKSGEFTDPGHIKLPSSLRPTKWERFPNLDNIVTPIVFEPISTYPDLIINNKHLLHSEFVRCFVSALINLQYCGRRGLQIDKTSSNFAWNFANDSWQGWYHVYALNGAGKGVPHRPVFNPKGRYVVRLFFMGSWRRFLIDDRIPIDQKSRPLLPRTGNVNEIWPLILAKAMLKVAACSSTSQKEIGDCSLVTCLTGWTNFTLNLSNLSLGRRWEFLMQYAKRFEWPKEEKREEAERKSSELEKGSRRKSRAKVKKSEALLPEEPQPVILFLTFEDSRYVDTGEIPGVTPCWSHQIYVELARDLPLDPAQAKEPFARWKHHRWLNWAMSQGLVDPSDLVPIRHLLIVSPLRECVEEDATSVYEGSQGEIKDLKAEFSRTGLSTKVSGKAQVSETVPKNKQMGTSMSDISLWADFNKLSPYLREIELFYRHGFFKFSMEVVDDAGSKEKIGTATKDDKKSGKSVTPRPPTPDRLYEYREKPSRNEPLHLFVDSIENKFFLVNLSTNDTQDVAENDQPRPSASLIVERLNWFDNSEIKSEVEIKTRGTKSAVFHLERGRHLLRLFVKSDYSYHLDIFSDTAFHIGSRLDTHNLMTTESDSVKLIADQISMAAKNAFKSFGISNYADCLKVYYQSYMPDSRQLPPDTNKKILKRIHRHFHEELANLLENRNSSLDSNNFYRALRIFFVDPSIGRQAESHYFQEESLEEEKTYKKKKPAVLIQSFFRMILIKRYKEIHDANHRDHNSVKQTLKTIGEFFVDEHWSDILLRALIKRQEIYKELYPCANDFKNIIQVQELTGRIANVLPDQWIPILRIQVNARKEERVQAAFDLFTSIPDYSLRVFANDTKREMLGAYNATATLYRHRKSGYTIFAHGRNDGRRLKELEWTLHLTTEKGEPAMYLSQVSEPTLPKLEVPPLILQQISDNYIPNRTNLITKLILNIKRDHLLSLRLKTSYEAAVVKLRVVDENGKTLVEVDGTSIAFLPIVFLKHRIDEEKISRFPEDRARGSRKSLKVGGSSHRSSIASKRYSGEVPEEKEENCTRYFVEVFVREGSWPLTAAEWSVVMEAKTRSFETSKRSSTVSRISKKDRGRSKTLVQKLIEPREALEEPHWVLQIVTEGEDDLEVLWDRSKQDRMRELRKEWKTEENGRSQRGAELRERFLEDNCLIIARSAMNTPSESIADDVSEAAERVGDICDEGEIPVERTLEPPADLGYYLPKLDLSSYVEKEEEEEKSWVKSEFDEEALRNQRAINVYDFEHMQRLFRKAAAEAGKRRLDGYRRLIRRCLEESEERSRRIEEAYELRGCYVDATKDATGSVRSSQVQSKDSKRKK